MGFAGIRPRFELREIYTTGAGEQAQSSRISRRGGAFSGVSSSVDWLADRRRFAADQLAGVGEHVDAPLSRRWRGQIRPGAVALLAPADDAGRHGTPRGAPVPVPLKVDALPVDGGQRDREPGVE